MASKPKVSISLYTYGWDLKTRKMTIKECVEHAASLDVDGIEIVDKLHLLNYPNQSVYDLRELRDYVESFGMKILCYSTYVDNMIRSDRMATYEEAYKQVLDDIAEADILGAKIYRPATREDLENLIKPVLPTLKKI